MSRARLRELRMVGFKSFAERTVVPFGPGISAIVGPNGSGKSNLADALRWTLGEQGRALRTRRAEDLIFAGSAKRRGVGMADVSLVIENGDRLLPVDFGEVELSRRLYRSGENEYLLNRQRVRLRDLIDLLDDANLADNAFLFIGQGMVDQALALRPEERRPLFEEAAGIRKHERRRRQAESDLAEASANLERVRDLLAELRPQARRLAAQAEQQEARRIAGLDLAEALVALGRSRLGSAEREALRHGEALRASRAEADAALASLRDAEDAAATLARALSQRADDDARRREALEAARGRVVELRLAEARAASEAEGLVALRARLSGERGVLSERVAEARAALASDVPEPDHAAEEALLDADRRLAEAERDADDLRLAGRADAERSRATRSARDRLAADAARAARLGSEAAARLSEQERAASAAAVGAEAAEARLGTARHAMALAVAAEAEAEEATTRERGTLSEAEAREAAARTRQAGLAADRAALQARLAALSARLEGGPDERTLRSARARGGRRLSDGLEVEPGLRLAVEAALGDVLAGLLLDPDDALALQGGAAIVVLRDAAPAASERAGARVDQAVSDAGGGPLATAVRRDPDGHAARLLARCRWVPDLATALRLRGSLPAGWRLVTPSGEVLDDLGVVRPAPRSSLLGLQSERDDVGRLLARASGELERVEAELAAAREHLRSVARAIDDGRDALESARRERRVAEEQERAADRGAESAARESAWAAALLERARRAVAVAEAEAAARSSELAAFDASLGDDSGRVDAQAVAAAEARVAALRRERDVAARAASVATAAHEAGREARRRAEIALLLSASRGEELDREELVAAEAEGRLAALRERQGTELAVAAGEQDRLAAAYEASVASGRGERERLLAAEAAAAAARERLRAAEVRSRHNEVAEMETRLQLDAAREALLVELASIGRDGLGALAAAGAPGAPGSEPGPRDADAPAAQATDADLPAVAALPADEAADASESGEDLTEALEHALDEALRAWRSAPPDIEVVQPPGPGRLSSLRRRFHELGASNPFAAQELAEVSARLGSLEAQREDLESAIRDTRELIGRLDTLITEQFRQTFLALEGAFGRRFEQLFGGGEAQLVLTAPDDLSSTGVEITARPPGKKRQPLAMLSGGERALTAVALLMAMLEVRPVPFCVLDEVDAALDEANIERFSGALRSLAEKIQFIVITHNRGTIEAADALYGVTVGDDAVSRVVSLRLGDLPGAEGPSGPAAVALGAAEGGAS
jgi:chromosome segregation protein